jgi:hypothetical protein
MGRFQRQLKYHCGCARWKSAASEKAFHKGRRNDKGIGSSETLLLRSSHPLPYFVEKLDGARRKPGVMIVEEPQDTNAALEPRRMMGTQVSISPGCGEFIFGLDRRRLFQLRVDLKGQKLRRDENYPRPKIT